MNNGSEKGVTALGGATAPASQRESGVTRERERTCEGCDYAVHVPLQPNAYECHGAPPMPVFDGRALRFLFAIVGSQAWCSVWKARTEPRAEASPLEVSR